MIEFIKTDLDNKFYFSYIPILRHFFPTQIKVFVYLRS